MFNAVKLLETRKDVIYVAPGYDSFYDYGRLIGYSDNLLSYVTVSGSYEGLNSETEKLIMDAYKHIALDKINRQLIAGSDPLTVNDLSPYDFSIKMYYGNYNGCIAVIMGSISSIDAVSPTRTVADVTFYGAGYLAPVYIIAWKDGEFYDLQDAYDSELLTKEDLANIAYFHHRPIKNIINNN